MACRMRPLVVRVVWPGWPELGEPEVRVVPVELVGLVERSAPWPPD